MSCSAIKLGEVCQGLLLLGDWLDIGGPVANYCFYATCFVLLIFTLLLIAMPLCQMMSFLTFAPLILFAVPLEGANGWLCVAYLTTGVSV